MIEGTISLNCGKNVMDLWSGQKKFFVIFRFTVPYEEYKEDDPEEFKKSLRLSVELFDELLAGIEHEIAREVSLPWINTKTIIIICQ